MAKECTKHNAGCEGYVIEGLRTDGKDSGVCENCKKGLTNWNLVSSVVRELAIANSLPVPENASDRLSKNRAKGLQWTDSQIERVFKGATEITGSKNLHVFTEEGFRNERKKILLAYRQEELRQQESREVRVKFEHNNIQKTLEARINATDGFVVITEKNYVDLAIYAFDREFIVEVKTKASKGDVEHAVGHLRHAAYVHGGEKVLSLPSNLNLNDLKWLEREGISVVNHTTMELQLMMPDHYLLNRLFPQLGA